MNLRAPTLAIIVLTSLTGVLSPALLFMRLYQIFNAVFRRGQALYSFRATELRDILSTRINASDISLGIWGSLITARRLRNQKFESALMVGCGFCGLFSPVLPLRICSVILLTWGWASIFRLAAAPLHVLPSILLVLRNQRQRIEFQRDFAGELFSAIKDALSKTLTFVVIGFFSLGTILFIESRLRSSYSLSIIPAPLIVNAWWLAISLLAGWLEAGSWRGWIEIDQRKLIEEIYQSIGFILKYHREHRE
ncbi:hypothetical protein HY256_05910 [Candidatus Sumerlaeota bacterium]|nr:hypothetical protein [Candidatus Sumerlaeota bacterium]